MPNKTSVSKRKWLLLPIETKARELLGKTLLACYAAERGWGVVLGDKEVVRNQQPLLPKGVILEKDADPTHEELVAVARANGNRLSAMDEEGLLALSGDIYLKSRVSKTYFDALDYFFAWGDVQAKWLESVDGSNGKVVRSGSPRFDMLRPEFRTYFDTEASKRREKHGRMILFNTNFAFANPNAGRDPLVFLKESGKLPTREREFMYLGARDFDRQKLNDFLELVPIVASRYRHHTIVVRPHPSESHEPWDEIARDHENVLVCYEGSAQVWIRAAEIMIHSNCTTGVESYLMGSPSISYRLREDERFDYPLTSDVSVKAASVEELIELIDTVVSGRSIEDRLGEQVTIVNDYVSGTEGRLAIETIVECLESLDLSPADAVFPIKPRRPSLVRRVSYKGRQLLNSVSGNSHARRDKSNLQYVQKKFPGIDLNEIKDIVGTFDQAVGRFADVRVTQICRNTFGLYAN